MARKEILKNKKLKYDEVKPVLIHNQNLGFKGNELYKIINKKLKRNVKRGHIFSRNNFYR